LGHVEFVEGCGGKKFQCRLLVWCLQEPESCFELKVAVVIMYLPQGICRVFEIAGAGMKISLAGCLADILSLKASRDSKKYLRAVN
jgi:hypothetical protein